MAAEMEALVERRRALGLDRYNGVWQGEYSTAPASHPRRGDLDQEIAVALHPLARADDYRVPDREGAPHPPGHGVRTDRGGRRRHRLAGSVTVRTSLRRRAVMRLLIVTAAVATTGCGLLLPRDRFRCILDPASSHRPHLVASTGGPCSAATYPVGAEYRFERCTSARGPGGLGLRQGDLLRRPGERSHGVHG